MKPSYLPTVLLLLALVTSLPCVGGWSAPPDSLLTELLGVSKVTVTEDGSSEHLTSYTVAAQQGNAKGEFRERPNGWSFELTELGPARATVANDTEAVSRTKQLAQALIADCCPEEELDVVCFSVPGGRELQVRQKVGQTVSLDMLNAILDSDGRWLSVNRRGKVNPFDAKQRELALQVPKVDFDQAVAIASTHATTLAAERAGMSPEVLAKQISWKLDDDDPEIQTELRVLPAGMQGRGPWYGWSVILQRTGTAPQQNADTPMPSAMQVDVDAMTGEVAEVYLPAGSSGSNPASSPDTEADESLSAYALAALAALLLVFLVVKLRKR